MSFYACKRENRLEETQPNTEVKTSIVESMMNSSFERDSTLTAQKVDLLFVYSENQIDTLIGFCNCEKNVKTNTLKIQIRTEFPSLSELEKGNRSSTIFQMGVDRQFRFLTFYLRDSTVEKTKLFKASTESQFENEKVDSASFQNYNLKINRFNYEIAQNVWGTYEIVLLNHFGYTSSDYRLVGSFHCNNWKIVEFEELLQWTIKGEKFIE
ncbi:MAG: hypothetical protein COW03_05700 [Cytophagales bacterium CG12_big_fil_rev_8_21_14_0_65_40_12]|nr:MAG: hypothetical protein COW03_05700 [Cytophagales bacterium CG12_big_fil_rev_8_21_14_0_65_40_12]PIW03225.1 MAG: hypothetical protein COW40_15945 [Cytophagales bacterium CG17_big_fil_post_rev_8_21_14_2_50_40_13]